MTDSDQPPLRDSRFAIWIGATAGLFVLALAVGFIWLPSAQRGANGLDLWSAICRAIGLPDGNASASKPVAGLPASAVAWTTATRRKLEQGDSIAGATIAATTCNNCHGADGISTDAAIPNLAGQSATAVYKQLEDFRSGKRYPAVMGVYVSPLSEQNLIDLSAYYASLPSHKGTLSAQGPAYTAVRRLIEVGDPLRGIAPCAACHGPVGLTPGAPGLKGQQRAYLELQLQLFKNGERRNDISEQMRTIARQLTGEEIATLAAYYSNVGNDVGR
jgi:cytochrome c553